MKFALLASWLVFPVGVPLWYQVVGRLAEAARFRPARAASRACRKSGAFAAWTRALDHNASHHFAAELSAIRHGFLARGKDLAGLAELEPPHSGSGLCARTFRRGSGLRLAARLARDPQPLQRTRVR